ncbi:MAG: radical SAM protein [Candidatus Pacebacteria bacterium]|nr:radical SAM protein [Candidatus Paceibacterota bacterium]
MINEEKYTKIIKSSTMKCRLSNNLGVSKINISTEKLERVVYERNEKEGKIYLMEDYSIIRKNKNNNKKRNKNIQRFRTPISVRWDITYQCNFQCRHCYSSCSSKGINILKTEDAKKMFDIFEDAKVHFVQILGGEPLIRKDIYELVEYALTKKYIFSLNSNGYLLDEDAAKKFSSLGLKNMQISLHGFEDNHNMLTGVNDSFNRAINAIKFLINSNINVSVSCLVSNINKDKIILFLNYLIEIGVKNIQLLTLLKEGRGKEENIGISENESEILKKELIEFKKNHYDINIDLPGFDIDLIDGLVEFYKNDNNYEFIFGCSGGVTSMRINPEGKACICVGSVSNPIGDVLREPMSTIMKKMYQWRLDNVPLRCKDCEYYLYDCQGGCYLR